TVSGPLTRPDSGTLADAGALEDLGRNSELSPRRVRDPFPFAVRAGDLRELGLQRRQVDADIDLAELRVQVATLLEQLKLSERRRRRSQRAAWRSTPGYADDRAWADSPRARRDMPSPRAPRSVRRAARACDRRTTTSVACGESVSLRLSDHRRSNPGPDVSRR